MADSRPIRTVEQVTTDFAKAIGAVRLDPGITESFRNTYARMDPGLSETARQIVSAFDTQMLPAKVTADLEHALGLQTRAVLDRYSNAHSSKIAEIFKQAGDAQAARISEQFKMALAGAVFDAGYAKRVSEIMKVIDFGPPFAGSVQRAVTSAASAEVAVPVTVELSAIEDVAHAAEEAPTPSEFVERARGMSKPKRAALRQVLVQAAAYLMGVVGALTKIGEFTAAQNVCMLVAMLLALSNTLSDD
jgi:hypothetical protein